ncbi:MAG TPA: hypothetical protein VK629_07470 [Steroidobacteraceae bacterium]|nr:hypothetical protein [Steroidobacteraceae bacterium]
MTTKKLPKERPISKARQKAAQRKAEADGAYTYAKRINNIFAITVDLAVDKALREAFETGIRCARTDGLKIGLDDYCSMFVTTVQKRIAHLSAF